MPWTYSNRRVRHRPLSDPSTREMPLYEPPRFVRVAWDAIEESDLRRQGQPEISADVFPRERQLVLVVRGQTVDCLGLVAMRCERSGDTVVPQTLCIPDAPYTVDTSKTPAVVRPRNFTEEAT